MTDKIILLSLILLREFLLDFIKGLPIIFDILRIINLLFKYFFILFSVINLFFE